MEVLLETLQAPWPWYVSGPLIGILVPLMILIGSRSFGISQNLEHLCAITQPKFIRVDFFKYDWKPSAWSLVFAAGVLIGGYLAANTFPNLSPPQLSDSAQVMFSSWGLTDISSYNPAEVYGLNLNNIILLLVGGVFIGFGTRYGGGCTSGHAITGLSTLQPQSLFAVIGIFSGGLVASHFLVPVIIGN